MLDDISLTRSSSIAVLAIIQSLGMNVINYLAVRLTLYKKNYFSHNKDIS